MAELCNYYVFPDVDSPQSFLANIKNVAVSNGWICDKDDINDNWELYLHSNHGGRNLYYSMKMVHEWHFTTSNSYYAFLLYANTGFDNSKSVNEQPGKWGEFPNRESGPFWYNFSFDFPLLNQYVVASQQAIFVFIDFYKSVLSYDAGNVPNRLVFSLGFGSIDLYNEEETVGNFYFGDLVVFHYVPDYQTFSLDSFQSASLGKYDGMTPLGVLYNGVNKVDTNCGISVVRSIEYYKSGNRINRSLGDIDYGKQGFKYRDGVQWNEWCSRTTMLKPIVSIYYEDAENEYFFPIGELPYYSCCVWPRAKAGDVLTFGSRKFIIFPLISYTETYGIAIEVNP